MKDHKKLMVSFIDNDMIAKTIIIPYMEEDLAKVFKDYKMANNVFKNISTKYDSYSRKSISITVQLLQYERI